MAADPEGSLGTNILVNLMSPKADGLDLYRTMSILGSSRAEINFCFMQQL